MSSTHKTYNYKDISRFTKFFRFILYVFVAVSLLSAFFCMYRTAMICEIQGQANASNAVLANSDLQLFVVLFINMLLFLVCMPIYFVWLYGALRNARSFQPQDISFTPIRGILFYFIPVLNIFLPYFDLQELWKTSKAPKDWKNVKSSALIRCWWFLFVVTHLVFYIFDLALSSFEKPVSADVLLAISSTLMFSYLFQALTIWLLISIITQIHRNQAHAYVSLSSEATTRSKIFISE